MGLMPAFCWLMLSPSAHAALIGEFDFVATGSDVPNLASASGDVMHVEPNGTGFAAASSYGQSTAGDRLGQAADRARHRDQQLRVLGAQIAHCRPCELDDAGLVQPPYAEQHRHDLL